MPTEQYIWAPLATQDSHYASQTAPGPLSQHYKLKPLPSIPMKVTKSHVHENPAGIWQTIRSFFAANNLITRYGRRQIRRTFLSSGSAASRFTDSNPQKDPNDFSGWRVGSMMSCIVVGICLLANVTFLGYVLKFTSNGGVGVLFTGNCAKVKSLDRWLHLLINFIATALMACSNFNMQCLSSPTRKEVDVIHSKGRWLDIGIPSVRNLLQIDRKRVTLWVLLAVSSVPLHLLWNSVLFSTLQTNAYAVAIVGQNFMFDSETPHACNDDSENAILSNPYHDVICNMYQTAHSNISSLTRFEPQECIEKYGRTLQNDWSNVILVMDRALSENYTCALADFSSNSWTILSEFDQSLQCGFLSSAHYNPPLGSAGWICSATFAGVCDLTAALTNASRWNIVDYTGSGFQIDYCLASSIPQVCELQYNLYITIIITISTFVKLAAILFTLRTVRGPHLITIGDAIASFLTEKDAITADTCLMTKSNGRELVSKRGVQFSQGGKIGKHFNFHNFKSSTKANSNRPLRWNDAPSMTRWIVTILLCSTMLMTLVILLIFGATSLRNNHSITNFWSLGFGSVDENSMLSNDGSATGDNLTRMVLLANLPQAILSILYFMYNSVYTCMLEAVEWAGYAQQRKALRVTSPTFAQRSTYWLQLPWKYGLPLTIVSSVMHWLVSQSLFLVRINAYDPLGNVVSTSGAFSADTISTCGYSASAIVVTIIVGSLMVITLLIIGQTRIDSEIPLVGSCSLAISAACHRPPGDKDAAFRLVKWGAVKHETSQGPGHCCFTSFAVESPIPGLRYAGLQED